MGGRAGGQGGGITLDPAPPQLYSLWLHLLWLYSLRRTLDEALRDLCVQSLRVAALDHVEGHVEEDLGGYRVRVLGG